MTLVDWSSLLSKDAKVHYNYLPVAHDSSNKDVTWITVEDYFVNILWVDEDGYYVIGYGRNGDIYKSLGGFRDIDEIIEYVQELVVDILRLIWKQQLEQMWEL